MGLAGCEGEVVALVPSRMAMCRPSCVIARPLPIRVHCSPQAVIAIIRCGQRIRGSVWRSGGGVSLPLSRQASCPAAWEFDVSQAYCVPSRDYTGPCGWLLVVHALMGSWWWVAAACAGQPVSPDTTV